MSGLIGTEQIELVPTRGPLKRVGVDDLAQRGAEGGVLARTSHLHEIDNWRAYYQQRNGDGFEHDQPHVTITSVTPRWQATGADYPIGLYRCTNAAPGFIGFGGYPLNRPALVDLSGGSVTLYAGDGITVWRGTDDLHARTQVQFTSVVFDGAASTCTFAAGDPVTEGFAVGDVIEFLNTNTNANVRFQIRAFGGTSNRTLTLWPEPLTDAVADTAFTVRRRGRTALTFTAPALIYVLKSQGDIMASALTLSTTSVATVAAAPDAVRALIGQSWDVRMATAARRGGALRRRALGLGGYVNYIDAATGAQAVAVQEPVNANGLWDIVGNQPGKNYAPSLARIQRVLRHYSGVSLKHCQVSLGVGDIAGMQSWLTWQNMLAAYEAALARYVSDMNAFSAGAGDALRFWITPMQSINRGPSGIPTYDAICNLIRFVQLDVVRRNPGNCRRGIELYHRPQPFNDVHQDERVMGLIGAELEYAWLRDDDPATYPSGRGPKITGFAVETARRVRISISPSGGLSGTNIGNMLKPTDSIPYGFGICPNGDITAAPVPIVSHVWDGDDLVLTLAADVADPVPVYPHGVNHYAPFNWSALIQTYERTLEQYQPLQTLAHIYNESTGRWAPDFAT